MKPALNVFGNPLLSCSESPRTGFFRDGCCRTDEHDHGRHLVCAVMTDEFLTFSRERGNDLTTPMPVYHFPGLKAGDRWCLCVSRWKEALEAGCAPPVVLEATNAAALQVVEFDDLLEHAVAAD
jgi:uncharacterized protein (DUF2237 family)